MGHVLPLRGEGVRFVFKVHKLPGPVARQALEKPFLALQPCILGLTSAMSWKTKRISD